MAPPSGGDEAAVLSANQAFYDAFEARDLEAMSRVWEASSRVVCTHPGWPTLRGWPQVRASWDALMSGPQRLQFIVTNAAVEVLGDTAWVTLEENLLEGGTSGTVASVNWFVRHDGGWKLVGHHGSSVVARFSHPSA
jgi:ketosteroid isomerase-like protein